MNIYRVEGYKIHQGHEMSRCNGNWVSIEVKAESAEKALDRASEIEVHGMSLLVIGECN